MHYILNFVGRSHKMRIPVGRILFFLILAELDDFSLLLIDKL